MADRPSITDRLEGAEEQILNAVEVRVSVFQRIMRNISSQLRDQILVQLTSPISPLSVAKLDDLLYVQAELTRQLNLSRYNNLAQRFVANFEPLKAQAAKTARIVVGDREFAPLDENLLHRLKQTSLSWLDEIGRRAVNEVAQGLMENAILGGSKANMIARISTALTKFESHAATYAETAIVTYDREIQWQTFRNAGIDKLRYTGPKDIKNRPFCKQHVGKSYTREEIAKLDNGTTLMPVSRFGGGWNCRHVFMPDPTEAL